MTNELIPDDIHSTAVRVVNDHYDSFSDRSLYDIVTEALLSERLSATERAAKIAEDAAEGASSAAGNSRDIDVVMQSAAASDIAEAIAAAIRSQP